MDNSQATTPSAEPCPLDTVRRPSAELADSSFVSLTQGSIQAGEATRSRPSPLSEILKSPTAYWGVGNMVASVGVSWIGLVGNGITTLIGLKNEVRAISSSHASPAPPSETRGAIGWLQRLLVSPAFFATCDTAIVALAAVESLCYHSWTKGAAFMLFALGGIGAVADMARSSNTALAKTDNTKAATVSIPSLGKHLLFSTGFWWCCGDIVMGVSELSVSGLKASWSVTAFTVAAIATAVIGMQSGIRAAVSGGDKRTSLYWSAGSYLLFSAANAGATNFLMTTAFGLWALSSINLARRAGSNKT